MAFLESVLGDTAHLLDHGPGIYGACMTCFWVIYMTRLWYVAVLAHLCSLHCSSHITTSSSYIQSCTQYELVQQSMNKEACSGTERQNTK